MYQIEQIRARGFWKKTKSKLADLIRSASFTEVGVALDYSANWQTREVLKCKDVVKYLHICRRTLDNYVAKGYLDRVYGGTGRAIGISRASYERFTERERLAQAGAS